MRNLEIGITTTKLDEENIKHYEFIKLDNKQSKLAYKTSII